MQVSLYIISILTIAEDVYGELYNAYPPRILIPRANGTVQIAVLNGPTPIKTNLNEPTQATFHLYNRKHSNVSIQINIGDVGDFNYEKKTFFIVHGFAQSGFDNFVTEMTFNLLQRYDSNVISVDWQHFAQSPFYNRAKINAKLTGESIAKFIDYLIEEKGAKANEMTCVGFSLGAHTCGFAGKMLNHGTKLGRITGLDPAKPLYNYNKPEERLNVDDAAFVDVIHTSGGFLSFTQPLGHVDFYPNNGKIIQPGCGLNILNIAENCSHSRACTYYIESIISFKFKSVKCGSWKNFHSGKCKQNKIVSMGFNCPNSTIGTYYLRTSRQSPYALG